MCCASNRVDHRKTRLWSNLVTAALAILFTLIAVEIGIRVRQWIRYGVTHHYAGGKLTKDEKTDLIAPTPGGKIGDININSLGFRGPEITDFKPSGTLRIAFLGASTTFCAEIRDDFSTWPHQVVERLKAPFPNLDIDYVNAGVGGYTTEQSLKRLESQVARLSPDVVVIYHANNDLARETAKLARQAGLYHRNEEDWLERYSLAWYLIKKNLLIRYRSWNAKRGRGRLDLETVEFTEGFRNRLGVLVNKSLESTDTVVLPTFSYKIRREQDEEERLRNAEVAIYYMPYLTPDSLLLGYERYNEVIREVALETGALLVETELLIPADDEHFADTMHLKVAGAVVLAEAIADALGAEPAIQRLAASVRQSAMP